MSKHGMAVRGKRPGVYTSWAQMRSRCNNPNVPEYVRYGGRGIKVCDRWSSFHAFYEDMGDRPEGHSIDRINVDGDYEPSNCRWSDRFTQTRNTRRNVRFTINGVTKCLADWIAFHGLNKNTVRVRLHRGWDIQKALGP